MTDRGRLLDLATDLVKAEGDNWAGRVNILGTAGVFLLVFLPAIAFDLVQVVVRLWDSQYETGLPPTISFVWTFGYLFLACVGVLALSEVLRARRRR